MIKRIIKISGTGKFLNYLHKDVPALYKTNDFERLNLIYGENGSGKTTLSIILKSLKDDSSLLVKKRAFDRSVDQRVEVLTDLQSSPIVTYKNNTWDNHYPNIAIFDIHFISNNIYTGLEIQNSHKKKLFEVIFGNEGISLKQSIVEIKDKIQKGKDLIKGLTDNIEASIGKVYQADQFCKLTIDVEIDNKIKAQKIDLAKAKNYEVIGSKSILSRIESIEIPFDKLNVYNVLSKSIDSISNSYLIKFKQHTEHISMHGKAEEWIEQGFESIKENTCPFCKRPFESQMDIIEAYNQYFNLEYKSLKVSISQISSQISGFNLDASIARIESTISKNDNLCEFWSSYIDNPPSFFSVEEYHAKLSTAFENVKQNVKEKQHDPIASKSTTDLDDFHSLIVEVNTKIQNINIEIDKYNSKIIAVKSKDKPDIDAIELGLLKLLAQQKKSDTALNEQCNELVTYQSANKKLNDEKDSLQKRLDIYTTTIFKEYTGKIYKYLQEFAPYLEIRDLDSAYIGSSKEPMIKYALHVSGNEVKTDDTSTSPTFKYSLSEGDKSALALAFFLTKLEVDGNLQNMVVVFDDPVSSFDLNRKSTTINKLMKVGESAKQLFVLTHNLYFASEFWKSMLQLPIRSECCKIEFIGNSSCIVKFDIDNETVSSILKDTQAIQNYLLNGCITEQGKRNIARCLRPALESYFHLKFYDLVTPKQWLGDFIGLVREANDNTNKFNRLKGSLDELNDINNYSKKYHHRSNSNCENEPITDAELRNYCTRTLELIQLI